MAFTKITAAGIGTTESVTLDGLSVINNGSFGGNLTVGGVLTYEDVTNVDSVGLITARNGIVVGSGITLSKDGDIFATGITTVSGNVKVGTGITLSPDGDVFFTGIITGNGSGLTNLATDLVNDTTPQLGGNLDVNTKNIVFGDSGGTSDDRLTFGAGTDLSIFHNGNHSFISDSGTGDLIIQTNTLRIENAAGDEDLIKATQDGAVELYHNNAKMLYTHSTGAIVKRPSGGETELTIYGCEGNDAHLLLAADDGDDNADYWRLAASTDGSLYLQNYTSGSWEKNLKATGDAGVDLYYDNTKRFEVTSSGTRTTGAIHINDGAADSNRISVGNGGDLKIFHTNPGSYIQDSSLALSISSQRVDISSSNSENMARFYEDGRVELYYDNSERIITTTNGFKSTKSGACDVLFGSTDGSGVTLSLDGASNGDGNGGDYCYISHNSNGNFQITADDNDANSKIEFRTRGDNWTQTWGSYSVWFGQSGAANQDDSLWNNQDTESDMAYYGSNARGTLAIKTDRATGYSNMYLNKTNVNASGANDTRWIALYWNGSHEGSLGYNTSSGNAELTQASDYRLKKDVADMTNGIDKIKLLRPITYQWNDLSNKPKGITLDGFLAHEVKEVIPQAVTGEKDAVRTDEDGNENVIDPQQIEQKHLIPTLTKALQEAIAKIEVLEAEVAALKSS